MALGDYLLANPDLIQGKTVLELGAGTGFTSILCARLGAARVTATDGSDEMVERINLNIATNDVRKCGVECRPLWFGDESHLETQPFDVILGADVTYDESILGPLSRSLSRLLQARPTALVLIAATVRRETT